jgi:hypothetical protein
MNVVPGAINLRHHGQVPGEMLVTSSGAGVHPGVQRSGRLEKIELPDLFLEVGYPDDHCILQCERGASERD